MQKIDYVRASYIIFNYLVKGMDRFVIYPFGKKGQMVKKILNEDYSIKEIAVADNYLSQNDSTILNVDELLDIQEKYIILLASDNEDIYDDIRDALDERLKRNVCDLAEIAVSYGKADGFLDLGAKLKIDECTNEQIKRIFNETKAAWKKLGEEEPYWSVVTHDEFKSENINELTIEKFYEEGSLHVFNVMMALLRNNVIKNYSDMRKLSILEVGCGCERVTKGLSKFFGRVDAVDISSGNLKIAMQSTASDNVNFKLISSLEDYEKLSKVDVVYSVLVLQHNCPPVIEYLINTMFGLLNDNGIAIFQVPTYRIDYSFDYENYIDKPHGMEMHILPQQKIFEIAYANDCIPMEVYQCNVTGQTDNSMMFVFKKCVADDYV